MESLLNQKYYQPDNFGMLHLVIIILDLHLTTSFGIHIPQTIFSVTHTFVAYQEFGTHCHLLLILTNPLLQSNQIILGPLLDKL